MVLEILSNLVPRYFHDIREIDAQIAAQQAQFDELGQWIGLVNDNFFIQTADDQTLTVLEGLFNILADRTTEDINFRRARLLNMFATAPPFTLYFLYGRLVSLVGRGMFHVTIDYNNYYLQIGIRNYSPNIENEIVRLLTVILPAHMEYNLFQIAPTAEMTPLIIAKSFAAPTRRIVYTTPINNP